jgi:transposase-like protein
MATSSNLYRGFRFPAEVIEHAVQLYHCFSLSLREVELIRSTARPRRHLPRLYRRNYLRIIG